MCINDDGVSILQAEHTERRHTQRCRSGDMWSGHTSATRYNLVLHYSFCKSTFSLEPLQDSGWKTDVNCTLCILPQK